MQNVCTKNNSAVSYINQQRGASLLEGIAYLGIAAIVILGAVSLLSTAFSSAESNRGAEEVLGLRTTIKKLYQGNYPSTAGRIANDLSSAKALPGTLIVNTGANPVTVTNAWGGAVTFASAAAGVFTITYASVPDEACVGMVSGSSGWTSVAVGAGSLTPPITGSQAVGLCIGNPNTIIWTGN